MLTNQATLRTLTDNESEEENEETSEHLSDEQLEDLTDEAIIHAMRSTDAEIARLEAFKVRCAALLDRRRKTEPSLIAELVDKLKISEKDAKALVTSSRALTDRLPCTLRLMRRGLLTFSLASKVVRATARLSDDQARKADEELEPRLPKKDPTQVRNAAYYAAGKADPDRERRSTQRRVASRCVKLARQGAT